MIHKIKTYTIQWLVWCEIIIEVDTNKALPTIEIIWLPDAVIRESKERIRSALRNSGVEIPNRKFILNLSPSDIRKSWTSFDLPLAIALLWSIIWINAYHKEYFEEWLFFGELGLDGSIKRIDWLLPMVIAAKNAGYSLFFIPAENLYELEYIHDIKICPVKTFFDLVEVFIYNKEPVFIQDSKKLQDLSKVRQRDVDFSHIKWQHVAKRALSIAASGLHNILMAGSPWSGKTLLARALQSILPPLHPAEILEVSQIYSVVWKLNKHMPLVVHRPFRAIHHTASRISIIGWGANLRPGEVSLSHRGILFLDELTEFPRETLEVLRQPLEDHTITITRVSWSAQYPANFMLVAAMNPCKCGYYKDPIKGCSCNTFDIKKYQSKLSGPLLDRIDMILEIPREKVDTLLDTSDQSESSEQIRERVLGAWDRQQARYKNTNILTNAQLSSKNLEQYIQMDEEAESLLKQSARQLTLSPRVIHRIIKLSRTIADMGGSEIIWLSHIAESFQYRSKTMFIEQE